MAYPSEQQPQISPPALTKKQREEYMANYARMGRDAGCPADQMRNFMAADVWLQPKQLEIVAKCRECDKPDGPKDVMAGGGRGAAKTHAILAQIFCDDCQRQPGLKVLVLRKVGRANKEQIQDFRKKLLTRLEHKYREQQSTIEFSNGSMVILGNFKDEKDIDKYLGLEYDVIHIVESNQLTLTKKMNILSCLRTNKQNWRPRCYEDTNPGGIGHAHNKQIFIIPYRLTSYLKNGSSVREASELTGTTEQEAIDIIRLNETRYVHCVVDDNAFVDKGYKEYLEKLNGWQREAWLNGNWDFLAGAYFTNFREDVHVFPNKKINFSTQNAAMWFGSFDYGFQHNTGFLLFAKSFDNTLYVMGEYQKNQLTPADHSDNIKGLLSEHHLQPSDLDSIVAGHDCFHRQEEGNTIAQTYAENGLDFIPAENARVNGWQRLLDCFGNTETNNAPSLYIHRNCRNLIEQIMMAQHHEKIAGDIQKFNANEDGDGGDDLLDALRCGVFTNFGSPMPMILPVNMGGYKPITISL